MVSQTDKRGKTNGTVAVPDQVPDEALAGIQNFEDAVGYFNGNEGVTNAGDVLGDGFAITNDKDILVNIPFLILDWTEILGDQGLYVSVRLMTSDSRKYRISDGSTGICKQLNELASKGVTRGVFVKGGLVKSEYWIDKETNEIYKDSMVPAGADVKRGATFYLATA